MLADGAARVSLLLWAVPAALALAAFATLLLRLRACRAAFKGLPQPPGHSAVWGHLKHFGDLRRDYPGDLHPHTYPHLLQRKFGLPDVFYLDLWPVTWPMLVVADPAVAAQVLTAEKHESVAGFMAELTGEKNLVSMHGPEWKRWRAIFNPGFASAHLMTLVPGIVDECEVFCEILDEHVANGDVFRLEEAATRLTVDIIGNIVLDQKFDVQRGENVFFDAMKDQIGWLTTITALSPHSFNPWRLLMQWRNSRRMYAYLARIVTERFNETRNEKKTERKKRVIDLALETYNHGDGIAVKAQSSAGLKASAARLDPTFLRYAIDQIRVFMFAGHDTTSSTICYIYHMMERHAHVCTKLLAEQEQVFGPDRERVAALIRTEPHRLNRLDYLHAVIKEVLRLYPPASSIRKGGATIPFLVDPKTGAQYPTGDNMIWINHVAIHRNPALWKDPDRFDPDRFLGEGKGSSNDGKDAWRPFEVGPRACIGQQLALLETKAIISMTCRKYRIRAAYDAMGQLANDGLGWPAATGDQAASVLGEVAYQSLRGTAKPRQGMPARVSLCV